MADRVRLAIILSLVFHLVSALFFVLIFGGAAAIILPYFAMGAPYDAQGFIDRAVLGSSLTAIGFAGWALFLAIGGALYAYALRASILEIWRADREILWKAAWSAAIVLFEIAGLAAYHFFARKKKVSASA